MAGETRIGPSDFDKAVFMEWFENFGNTDYIVDSPRPVGEGDAQIYQPLEVRPLTVHSLAKLIGELTEGDKEQEFNIQSISRGKLRRRTRFHHENPAISFLLVYVSHLRGAAVHREVASARRVIQYPNGQIGLKDYSIRLSGSPRYKLGRMTSPNYHEEDFTPAEEVARLMGELRSSYEDPLMEEWYPELFVKLD